MMRNRNTTLVLAAIVGSASAARAYVDLAPTLGRIVGDSKSIALVEVAAFDATTQTVTLKPVKTIKGDPIDAPVTNRVAPPDGETPPNIRLWAEPGSRGVWFATKTTALVCLGPAWYQVKKSGDTWKLGVDRPDLPLAYCGSVGRLADASEKMLAGATTTITVVVYGATDVDTSFDLALGRNALPGLAKVQRVRASLDMAQMVAAASGQDGYVVGPNANDAADLPQLQSALAAADAAVRAEAAESIGGLGAAGRPAVEALRKAMTDSDTSVRTAAAAAVLRVNMPIGDQPAGRDAAKSAVDVIRSAFASESPAMRRQGARAAALAGPVSTQVARDFADVLPALMSDADPAVKAAALEAVTTIGPSVPPDAAKSLVAVLTPLLGDPRWRVEAADALGRLGPNARPVPAALVAMLRESQKPVQWAAVRAMAQIGGDEAKPAVDYIKTALPGGSEVEQYDMMLYLALLGPTAADAAPVIRANRIKNPVLPSATLWAIGDTTRLPWEQSEDRRMGPGGPGGGGGPMDINRYMYSAYIRELGDRLQPVARSFAKRLLDGTAGTVPEWGYALLKSDLAGCLETLSSGLGHADRQVRQRAAVAIGFLGIDAGPAKAALQKALDTATDGREQRMLKWSLSKVSTPQ